VRVSVLRAAFHDEIGACSTIPLAISNLERPFGTSDSNPPIPKITQNLTGVKRYVALIHIDL